MPSVLYEIVELHNGDIVLQRSEDTEEPLVCIRFSAESLAYLGAAKFEVAKAMIEAGMEATTDIITRHENERDDHRFGEDGMSQAEFDEEFGEEFIVTDKIILH